MVRAGPLAVRSLLRESMISNSSLPPARSQVPAASCEVKQLLLSTELVRQVSIPVHVGTPL